MSLSGEMDFQNAQDLQKMYRFVSVTKMSGTFLCSKDRSVDVRITADTGGRFTQLGSFGHLYTISGYKS